MRMSEKRIIVVLLAAIIIVASGFIYSVVEEFQTLPHADGKKELQTVRQKVQNQLTGTKKKQKKATTTSTTSRTTTEDTQATTEVTTEDMQTMTTTEVTTESVGDAESIMNGDDGYLLPDADVDYVNKEKIEKMTPEQIHYAINEIYARHGLKFTDVQEQEFFEKKKWYIGMTDDQDEIILNEYEQQNINTMEEVLKNLEGK